MHQPPSPRSAVVIPLAILIAAAVAGCAGGAAASAAPSDAVASPSEAPSASAQPSVEPSASTSPPDDIPTACLTLGAIDCERARGFGFSTLAAGDPAVRYVQVGPFGCATGDHCPLTLVARPEGDVVLEFAEAQGISVHLKVAPDGTFEATREPGMGVPVEPASAAVADGDPIEFTLGHCGIFSGIDLDRAWWDPVGTVAMESGEAVNATAGVVAFLDEDHATFSTPTGFVLQLIRRDGPKLLPFCM